MRLFQIQVSRLTFDFSKNPVAVILMQIALKRFKSTRI